MAASTADAQTAAVSLFSDYTVMRTVPDFIGLNYDEATLIERAAGIHIADPNPDAPPVSNFWWEHKELVVVQQTPAAGSRIDRQVSVAVTLGPPEVPVGARRLRPAPPLLTAQAEADATGRVSPPAEEQADDRGAAAH